MGLPARLASLWPAWRSEWLVYQDDALVALDKPAWLGTDAGAYAAPSAAGADLRARLLAELAERDAAPAPGLGPAWQLDSAASGLVLFGRHRAAARALAEQLRSGRLERTYLAAVGGAGRTEARSDVGQRVVAQQGSRRLVEILARGPAQPVRRWLAAQGTPAGADADGGGPPAPRLMLHLCSVALDLPGSGARRVLAAPAPACFDEWLRCGFPSPLGDDRALAAALREAGARRQPIGWRPDTDAFRLVSDAGDGLPGVTIDRYGEFLVVALRTEQAIAAKERILDAADALGAAGVYLKLPARGASQLTASETARLCPSRAVRGRDAPDPLRIRESGLSLEVRLGAGLSTGIFLDQRDNRLRVRELAQGARVLNLFGYTGGFTVAAAAGGAANSVTIDTSAVALAQARRNLRATGADLARHALVRADVLPWLRRTAPRDERFDLVVLDPPTYSTTGRSRFRAHEGYGPLAALALRCLVAGGKLLACTNDRALGRQKLRTILCAAAREAGWGEARLEALPDPLDHAAAPGGECHMTSMLVTVG
ncbi:MAG: class I SAM-dependent methyltransferase [Deltaproteobacteria bacterium]|nr:class I SAM-dependent methyltransferase [Deltaproteobacteria bacterium]